MGIAKKSKKIRLKINIVIDDKKNVNSIEFSTNNFVHNFYVIGLNDKMFKKIHYIHILTALKIKKLINS